MHKIELEVTDTRSVGETVVEAVAKARGVDPLTLSPSLFEVVDPDALETLFAGKGTIGEIVFNYNRCEVSVSADGFVSVVNFVEPTPPMND